MHLALECFQAVRIDIDDEDFCACSGKAEGDLATDSRSPSCDQNTLRLHSESFFVIHVAQ